MPPDSPVNSGSSEDSGETSGGGGGGTTSGPVVNDPTTWEVKDNTLSVPGGATVTADAIKQAQDANDNAIAAIKFESGVTIGDSAFKNSRITSVTGWENVISIGDNAFAGTNISGELNLSSATTIGDNAFAGCPGITGTLNLSSATTIGDNAFAGCPDITGTPDLSSATTIGASAFAGCIGITGTPDLSRATTIGASAFEGTNISGELNLSSATKIGEGAFRETGVENVTFGTDVTIEAGSLDIENIAAPTSTGAFTSCTSLTTVTFNGSANVGAYAFYNCNLTSVTFNGSADVGERAFFDCNLTSVTFNGSADVGERAFGAPSMNTSLTTVAFNGPTEVGSMAFHNCTALNKVSGWDEVTSIGSSAFSYTGLTSVTLGAGLTTLEHNAFNGCNRLTSADLSACTKLDTIASGMFDSCTSLQAVFLSERIAQIGVEDQTPVFEDCNDKQVTVYTKRSEGQKITFVKEKDNSKIASIIYGATEDQWKNALNGSSGGTSEGTSLLSSFSAFRDLLS